MQNVRYIIEFFLPIYIPIHYTHEHSRKLAYKTVLFIPNQHRVCELSILCDKVPEQANPTHQIQKQKQNKSKQITSIN